MAGPCIYGLYDRGGNLRYIGKADDASKRLKSHMSDSRRRNTPLYDWIRKEGMPTIAVLEADCSDWKAAERRLIAEARARGDDLLNVAPGGSAPFCPSDIRASNGRNTAEAVHGNRLTRKIWELNRSIGAALKKGWVTNETRAKLRMAAQMNPRYFGQYSNLPDRAE